MIFINLDVLNNYNWTIGGHTILPQLLSEYVNDDPLSIAQLLAIAELICDGSAYYGSIAKTLIADVSPKTVIQALTAIVKSLHEYPEHDELERLPDNVNETEQLFREMDIEDYLEQLWYIIDDTHNWWRAGTILTVLLDNDYKLNVIISKSLLEHAGDYRLHGCGAELLYKAVDHAIKVVSAETIADALSANIRSVLFRANIRHQLLPLLYNNLYKINPEKMDGIIKSLRTIGDENARQMVEELIAALRRQ